MRYAIAISLIALAAACRLIESAPSTTAVPSPVSLIGSVQLIGPPAGAVIYAEVIAINGFANDLPDDSFLLTLTGPDETEIARATVRGAVGSWGIELLHTYNDEPIEVTLSARPITPSVSGSYASRTIALAGLEYRPAGVSGSITLPADSSTVGGESLLVTGLSSGLQEPELILELIADDGRGISSAVVNAANPYRIDETPWSANIDTRNFVGSAQLQLTALNPVDNTHTLLDEIPITIDLVAG